VEAVVLESVEVVVVGLVDCVIVLEELSVDDDTEEEVLSEELV